MTLIGITGTNGKTTTAFLLYDALNKLGRKCAYMGTIGFYLEDKVYSLPNTSPDVTEVYDMIITAYDSGYRYMTLEISSHGLDMNRLEGINFDYAVFTNLTQDHLDYHKTMGNYALAKQKLFNRLKPNGKAIVNADDKYKEYFLLENNNNIIIGSLNSLKNISITLSLFFLGKVLFPYFFIRLITSFSLKPSILVFNSFSTSLISLL